MARSRAAGPELLAHNRTLGGCRTGLAKITPSFGLQNHGVRHIIHTVGPVWHAGAAGEAQRLGGTHEDVLLASCYAQCLALAMEHGVRSIAFPAISTGIYGFPKERAAKIAVGHVLSHLESNALPERVTFCCFGEADAAVYRRVIDTRQTWLRTGR